MNNWNNWQQPNMNQWQDYNYNNNQQQQQPFQPPLPSEEPTETTNEDEKKANLSSPEDNNPPLPFVSSTDNDMQMGSPRQPPQQPPQPPTVSEEVLPPDHNSDINNKLLSESSQMPKDSPQTHVHQPPMNQQQPMNQWNNYPPNQNYHHQYPPHPHPSNHPHPNNHPHPGNHPHSGNQGFMQHPPHFPHHGNNFQHRPPANRFPSNHNNPPHQQYPMMFNQGPHNNMGIPPQRPPQKVLPAWIRAELAKREEEKMKKEQKNFQEKNIQEKVAENVDGGILKPANYLEDEESDQELPQDDRSEQYSSEIEEDFDREALKLQCTMRFITEILLDVTSKEIREVVKKELYKAKRATFAAKSKNKKSLLGTGLVAGYSSDEESSAEEENEEEESSEEEELTEEQLEVKMNEFERRQRALLRKLEERGEDKQPEEEKEEADQRPQGR